jgi:hypothetical protein
MKTLKYIILLNLIFGFHSKAQYLQALGSWNPVISANVITEAGNDYPSNYQIESTNNQTLINLSRGGGLFSAYFSAWEVRVSKIDIKWHNNLKLDIIRTGPGSGTIFSSITDGNINYQEVSSNPTLFFRGTGIFSNIPIKYRLRGFSVLIPVDTYSTSVIYTLIEL